MHLTFCYSASVTRRLALLWKFVMWDHQYQQGLRRQLICVPMFLNMPFIAMGNLTNKSQMLRNIGPKILSHF